MTRYSRPAISMVCTAIVIMFLAACAPDDRDPRAKDIFSDGKAASLAEAAREGNVKQIDLLISQGANVNSRGKGGITPLIFSMFGTNTKGFVRLLEHGADPNLQTDLGESAVYFAARRDESDTLKALLAHGGNPNLRRSPALRPKDYCEFWPTPIYYAILGRNPKNARILIKAGANLNVRDDLGNTPLICAASIRSFDVMLELLKAGADFRAKHSTNGLTVTWYMLDGPIDPKSRVFKSRKACMEYLEKKGVDFKEEKLKNAEILRRNQERVERERVLAFSPPIDHKYQATDYFAEAKVAELAEAARNGDVKRVDLLVSQGTNINGRGKGGLTPLLYSMTGESINGSKRLLERGADPNAREDTGESALHFAASRSDSTLLKLLLAHDADPNCGISTDETSQDATDAGTPIYWARTTENARILIKAGAKVNTQDKDGDTPLIRAAQSSCYDVMYVLLEANANFHVKNKLGATATWYIMNDDLRPKRHPEAFRARQKCIMFLESKGVDCKKEKMSEEEIQRSIEEIFSGKYDNEGTQKHDVPEGDGHADKT